MVRVKTIGRHCPECFGEYDRRRIMNYVTEQTMKAEPTIIADKVKRNIPLTEYQKFYEKCTGCGTYELSARTCPEKRCQKHYCTPCRNKWRNNRCPTCRAINPFNAHTLPCDNPHCDHWQCYSGRFDQDPKNTIVSYPCTCECKKVHSICDECFKFHTSNLDDKSLQYTEDIRDAIKQRQIISAGEDNRRQELTRALRLLGLSLREDSTLCKAYIMRAQLTERYNNVYKIAERMAQMRYLYEYTCYRNRMTMIRFEDPDVHDDDVPRLAEQSTLDTIGGFPRTWPWLPPNRPRQFRGLVRIIITFIRIREDYYKPGNKHSQYLKQVDTQINTQNDSIIRQFFNKILNKS